MESKVGSFNYHIESYLCDFRGKATLPLIGNFLLKAATLHAHERGFGYEAVVKDHTAWVLSRLTMEISDYPGFDEELTVETWIEDVTRYFTQRCLRFINQQGKTVGYARSIWAAIDTESRKPKDILSWRPDIGDFITTEIDCPIRKPGKVPEVGGEPKSGYTVRYSDIDINGHMNSIKYIEHTVDIFDLDIFKSKSIRSFEIMYLAECAFGDKLKLHLTEVVPGEFIVDTKKEGVSVCRCRIVWE